MIAVKMSLLRIMFLCFVAVRLVRTGLPNCGVGWTSAKDKCYFISSFGLNFYSAQEFCNYYGGKLLEIDGEDEFVAVRELTRNKKVNTRYWIGLTDIFMEGHFLKAESLEEQTFKKWMPREPNDLRGEDCVEADYFHLTWNDLACHNSRWFICENKQNETRY